MSIHQENDNDDEDSIKTKLINNNNIINLKLTSTIFNKSITIGTIAITLLSTAPVVHVVHPRYSRI